MKEELCICTIISKNYLAQARILTQSFLKYNKGKVFVLLVDEIENYFSPEKEEFEIITLKELKSEIPNFDQFCFKYNILEINTGVKPFFLDYLFREYHLSKLVFLDPDIMITNKFEDLSNHLDRYSIILIPHILEPYTDQAIPSEIEILKAGIYNLGFMALKNTEETKRILLWWKQRLYDYCIVNVEDGLFVDQKWANLIPCFSDQVLILRDKTYNIAYWNLHYCSDIQIIKDEYYLEGKKINFFHFSGFDPEDTKLSKHQNRFSLSNMGSIETIFDHYRQKLIINDYENISKWPYFYGKFSNGEIISNETRKQYWLLDSKIKDNFGNPFIVNQKNSFYQAINKIETNAENYDLGQKINLIINRFFPLLTKRRKILIYTVKSLVKCYKITKKFSKYFIVAAKKLIASIINKRSKFTKRKNTNEKGLNIFGYFLSETGMGEAARLLVRSIYTTETPFKIISVDKKSINRKKDLTILKISKLTKSNPYPINLMVINADQTHRLLDEKENDITKGKFNIGCWFWELNEFPDIWLDSFNFYQEIWTSSDFIVESIKIKSPVPVYKIPLPVQVKKIKDVDLSYFHLQNGLFTFLFVFDFCSFFERKNPLAVIRAFKKAFALNENVQLIIKSSNCNYDLDNLKRMKLEAAGFPIHFIDKYLLKDEIDTLTSLCDCYVSLHRSEGFGLGMAEAMYLGKPVIATNYSGNLEFMNKNNSYLVDYKLVKIINDIGPYKKGQMWADPDLLQAANFMRYVYDNKQEAKKMGEVASRDIKEKFSFETIGKKINKRIEYIYG